MTTGRGLRSTNPLERVNREIGRGTDVAGIFPTDRSLIRLAASVVIDQNDKGSVTAAFDQNRRDGPGRDRTSARGFEVRRSIH